MALVVGLLLASIQCYEAFDSNWTMTTARKAQLDAIMVNNAERRDQSRAMSALIYTTIALGMLCIFGLVDYYAVL